MKNNQLLEELLNLSNEINQAIYESVSDDAKAARLRNYQGSAKSYVDDIKRKASELASKVSNSSVAKKAVDVAGKVEDKAFTTAEAINQKGVAGWAKDRAHVRGGQVADLAKAAYNNPSGYVAANKGALGAAAGVAALGAGVYAAKKMAQHKRWIKNGCESIVDAGEKLKCKNYVASKKA